MPRPETGFDQTQPFFQSAYSGPQEFSTAIRLSLEHLAGLNHEALQAQLKEEGGFSGYGYAEEQLKQIEDELRPTTYGPFLHPAKKYAPTYLTERITHLNPDSKIATARLAIKHVTLTDEPKVKKDWGFRHATSQLSGFALPLLSLLTIPLSLDSWGNPGNHVLTGILQESVRFQITQDHRQRTDLVFLATAIIKLDQASQAILQRKIIDLNTKPISTIQPDYNAPGKSHKVTRAKGADAQWGADIDTFGDHYKD